MVEIDGATGRLFLDSNGRVHRHLAWAQFQRGEVVPLPRPETPGGPIGNITEGRPMESDAADEVPWDEETDDRLEL